MIVKSFLDEFRFLMLDVFGLRRSISSPKSSPTAYLNCNILSSNILYLNLFTMIEFKDKAWKDLLTVSFCQQSSSVMIASSILEFLFFILCCLVLRICELLWLSSFKNGCLISYVSFTVGIIVSVM